MIIGEEFLSWELIFFIVSLFLLFDGKIKTYKGVILLSISEYNLVLFPNE